MSLPRSARIPILAALVAALASTPLGAQELTRADSASLVRDAAAYIGWSYVRGADTEGIIYLPPETAFDSAMAVLLADAPELRRAVRDSAYALRLGTRGVRWRGDTVVVVLRLQKCEESDDELNWWADDYGFHFIRAGEGWRFTHRLGIGNIDGHCGVMTPALRELRDEVKRGLGVDSDGEVERGVRTPVSPVLSNRLRVLLRPVCIVRRPARVRGRPTCPNPLDSHEA